MEAVGRPANLVRLRRFPAKRNAALREVWQLLRTWMKGVDEVIDLPGLTKQQRWYAHQWCECWRGLHHWSTGEDGARILHVRKSQAVFRRQMQTDLEKHVDDALQEPSAAESTDHEFAEEGGTSRVTLGGRVSESVGEKRTSEKGEGNSGARQIRRRAAATSAVRVERQDGIDCLRHCVNNCLLPYGVSQER